jgi:hypothetical protein
MNTRILMMGALALAISPTFASAAPGGKGGSSNVSNSPPVTTGQPGADCEELVASGEGSTPGNSASAPGSAFNPDGNAGKHYAGEQPQNSKNTASVSQYDSACRPTPRSPQ